MITKTVRTHIIGAVFAARSVSDNTTENMNGSVTDHIISGGEVHVWRYANKAADGYADELLTVVALLSRETYRKNRAGESVLAVHEITEALAYFGDDDECTCC
jgi:hypothetical protein